MGEARGVDELDVVRILFPSKNVVQQLRKPSLVLLGERHKNLTLYPFDGFSEFPDRGAYGVAVLLHGVRQFQLVVVEERFVYDNN